jgi:cell division protein FtsW (lipid II flippase)
MGVTIRRAGERPRKPSRVPGMPGIPGLHARRGREGLLLAGAAVLLMLGLLLVWKAVSRSFPQVEADLASGRTVDLNDLRQPEQLLPLLDFLDEPVERAFVARQIARRAQEGRLLNVGELARLRVPAAEIQAERRLPGLRERLGDLKKARADEESGKEVTVRLLTLDQLRALKPHLVVRRPGEMRSQLLLWPALMLLAFAAIHVAWRMRGFPGDQLLLPAVLALAGLGLLVMVAVRDPLRDLLLFRTFAEGVLIGCALLFAASQIDPERSPLRRLTWAPLLAAFLLSALLIVLGSGPGGSDVKVNLFGMQPVEAIKLLVVLFLAGYFFDRWEFLRELPETRGGLSALPRWLKLPKLEYGLPPVIALGLVLFFFFLQRDLGPALVLAFLFLLLYSVARGRWGMLAVGVAVVVAGFMIGYKLHYPKTVSGRIEMWLSPWDNSFRGGDHLAQALWAFSSGSLTGTGLGLGEPGYVPEVHTDLVLSAIGEELGFLGLLAVFGLYALVVARGFRAARRADGVYGFFLAYGLTLLIVLHMLLIGGGVLGLFPLSGVVSPFLSSGRSAMLANFLAVGLLLAISAHAAPGGSGAAETTQRFRGSARAVALGIAAVGVLLLLRAFQVQVLQDDKFLTRGALTLQADGYRRFLYNPRLVEIADTIPRGSIVDRNGVPLATSDEAEIEKHQAELQKLGAIPGMAAPAGAAGAAPAPSDRPRVYPFGGRTFHLTGDLRTRANWGASNTSFVERDSRIRLQGYDDYAAVVQVKQPNGEMSDLVKLDYGELIPLLRHRYRPEHAAVKRILERDRTVRMTIDVRLQLRVGEILRKYAAEGGAGAAAVVLDPATGEVLAAVGYPWPERSPVRTSEMTEETKDQIIDRARYGVYPPGSTFKIVTAMAAMRKDPGLARTTYVCRALSQGRVGNYVRGWGKPIRDDVNDTVPHGVVDLQKGIVESCNAYFAQLGTYEVGPEALLETAKALGITVARPNTPEKLKDALPQASYGQGQVVATPFQMARVAATVANGGNMPEGRWVLNDGHPPVEPKPILAPGAVELISRSMRQVVTEGTAATILGRLAIPIAGKTGTAEVQGKRSHSWFIGFAPYGTGGRKLAFAVIVEHGGYGGRLAAQATGEIVQAAESFGLMRAQESTP